MQPIIVTYSNESWIANSGRIISVTTGFINTQMPRGGFYFCENVLSKDSQTIYFDEIKLIARPKK